MRTEQRAQPEPRAVEMDADGAFGEAEDLRGLFRRAAVHLAQLEGGALRGGELGERGLERVAGLPAQQDLVGRARPGGDVREVGVLGGEGVGIVVDGRLALAAAQAVDGLVVDDAVEPRRQRRAVAEVADVLEGGFASHGTDFASRRVFSRQIRAVAAPRAVRGRCTAVISFVRDSVKGRGPSCKYLC
jgi:hypothetical protein